MGWSRGLSQGLHTLPSSAGNLRLQASPAAFYLTPRSHRAPAYRQGCWSQSLFPHVRASGSQMGSFTESMKRSSERLGDLLKVTQLARGSAGARNPCVLTD